MWILINVKLYLNKIFSEFLIIYIDMMKLLKIGIKVK